MLRMLQNKKLCGGPQGVCYLNILKRLEVDSVDGVSVCVWGESKETLRYVIISIYCLSRLFFFLIKKKRFEMM